ncbi:hypothetical protein C6P40_003893 [Pichia californica]|uniref:NAD-dependent epimerase/dehydratase domain-containing protein n=1 Tax=Pichia californica TaxID=460514 RepID=A0A9P6WPU4_9ASCO|nr:hypothetical protein C6P42_005387 [[Candida] californica]KAG0690067.1 hypothetical protein C6P40_003893 [[Candida] californica]
MVQPVVLVTGATGFIAQHVIDKLLARNYSVIGTGRSEEKNSVVIKNFKEKYPKGELSFAVVPEIGADDAFDDVLKEHPEVKYVIHMASPIDFSTTSPLKEFFLDAAVTGTLNILKAIKRFAPNVTNVVLTSSYVSLMQNDPQIVLTNDMWNPITWDDVKNSSDAYRASKFATVNPALVTGPQVFDSSVNKVLNGSNQYILHVVKTDDVNSKAPQDQLPIVGVDVRDTAEFHILPLEIEALSEDRILLVDEPFIGQRVFNILNDNFPELKGKIPVGDYNSVDELEEKFCPKQDISNIINKIPGGYKFIPLETSLVDTFKQYLAKEEI